MTEVLQPYTDFPDEALANSLHAIALRNKGYLQRRGYYGFVQRYGGELALQMVQKGKRDHEAGRSSHFTIVQTRVEGAVYKKEIIGAASIQKGLPLYKLPELGPLTPPPVAAEKLGLRKLVDDERLTHNIGVIVDVSLLGPSHEATSKSRGRLAYKELVKIVEQEDSSTHAWMLIPEYGFIYERAAAVEAGLGGLAVGRFDDLESRRHVPPRSVLCVSGLGE
jgi:hypothetical protein